MMSDSVIGSMGDIPALMAHIWSSLDSILSNRSLFCWAILNSADSGLPQNIQCPHPQMVVVVHKAELRVLNAQKVAMM